MQHLEKIVNDGLVKYKAFKEADDAIKQIKSLMQAEADLGKVVAKLEKERDALMGENSKLSDKISEAEKKASEIIFKAEADAKALLEAARDNIKDQEGKAMVKLDALNDSIASAEAKKAEADVKAKESQDKLDKINSELEAAKNRLQKMLG